MKNCAVLLKFFYGTVIFLLTAIADPHILTNAHAQNIFHMVQIRTCKSDPVFFLQDLKRLHKKALHNYSFLAVTDTHSP